MSELQAASIRSYPTGGTVTVNDNITIASGKSLTVTDAIAANGGVTLGGTLTCGGNAIAGAGAIGGTTITGSGALVGASLNVSTGTIDGGVTTVTSATIGSSASAASTGCANVSNQLFVENDTSAATAVTVSSGNVDASSSELKVDSLTVGGVNYDSTQFANFNATAVLKAFGKLDYNVGGGSVSVAGAFGIGTPTISGAVITIPWSATYGTDYTVLLSSTEDGDEPDTSGNPGDQKIWQVTSQASSQVQITLKNSNSLSATKSLFFLILDV